LIAIDKHTGKNGIASEIVSRGLMSDNVTGTDRRRATVNYETVEESTPRKNPDWGVIKEKSA